MCQQLSQKLMVLEEQVAESERTNQTLERVRAMKEHIAQTKGTQERDRSGDQASKRYSEPDYAPRARAAARSRRSSPGAGGHGQGRRSVLFEMGPTKKDHQALTHCAHLILQKLMDRYKDSTRLQLLE